MTLTRNTFQLLAEALREARPTADPSTISGRPCSSAETAWVRAIEKVADALASTNPRFDRDRFYAAATKEA